MKKDNMRGLDPAEMKSKLTEIDEQSFRFKFQMAMGQTEGLRKLREMRKDRARLLTYLRQRDLGIAAPVEKPVAKSAKKSGKKTGAK